MNDYRKLAVEKRAITIDNIRFSPDTLVLAAKLWRLFNELDMYGFENSRTYDKLIDECRIRQIVKGARSTVKRKIRKACVALCVIWDKPVFTSSKGGEIKGGVFIALTEEERQAFIDEQMSRIRQLQIRVTAAKRAQITRKRESDGWFPFADQKPLVRPDDHAWEDLEKV